MVKTLISGPILPTQILQNYIKSYKIMQNHFPLFSLQATKRQYCRKNNNLKRYFPSYVKLCNYSYLFAQIRKTCHR